MVRAVSNPLAGAVKTHALATSLKASRCDQLKLARSSNPRTAPVSKPVLVRKTAHPYPVTNVPRPLCMVVFSQELDADEFDSLSDTCCSMVPCERTKQVSHTLKPSMSSGSSLRLSNRHFAYGHPQTVVHEDGCSSGFEKL